MKLLLITAVMALTFVSCSKKEDKTLGYWISDDNSYFLKIEKEESKFVFLNSQAKSDNPGNICPNVKFNHDSVTLNCALTKNEDFEIVLNENDQLVSTRKDMPGFLKRAPNLTISNFQGTWKDEESNGVNRSIYITTQKENTYDLESFVVAERQKAFKQYLDENFKIEFSEGFIFTDLSRNGYKFYVTQFNDDWYEVVDQTGYSWKSAKYDGNMIKELEDQGYKQVN